MIPTVRVEINRADLDRMFDKARTTNYVNTAIKQITSLGKQSVMRLTPGKGVVRSKWHVRYHHRNILSSKRNQIYMAEIYNIYDPQEVLIWLEYGTKPHIIPVGIKGFLAFQLDDGTWVFTKKPVHHPGTIPYQMVKLTVEFLNANMQAFMNKAVTEFVNHLNN